MKLFDAINTPGFDQKTTNDIRDAVSAIPRPFYIMYRGIRYNKFKGIAPKLLHVTNDRDTFMGGHDIGPKYILSELGIKNPTFVRFDQNIKFFGNPYIIIPIGQFKVYQSELVTDIMGFTNRIKSNSKEAALTDDQIIDLSKQAVVSYQEITGTNNVNFNTEAIVDCTEYYAIHTQYLEQLSKKSKKSSIKYYSDLMDIL